ncbi:MAG: envelope stress response membrane protein PspB [Woeseiaceae bacterium]|nr:envelope stress response membrane protein PspB [Woeseiaceae bacterium]
MTELVALAVILFLTIVAPLIVIFYFITRWKQTREISGDDERMLEELWALSQRLEDRIETLERILDDEPTSHRRQQ